MLVACEAPEVALDGALETADAPSPGGDGGTIDAGGAAVVDGGERLDAGPRPDTGAGGPDVRVPEDCAMPGDEDGDRLSDCDDPDCWSGCAASHVAGMHPGLVECGMPVAHTATQGRDVCMTYSGESDDAPTLCLDTIPYASMARFFCEPGGQARALWLEEHLSFPPLMRRDVSGTTFEFIDYEYTPARDRSRVSQGSGSGGREPELSMAAGSPDVVVISVYPIEAGDTAFERMVGATRITETVTGEPPRIVATGRELFRTGGTRLIVP